MFFFEILDNDVMMFESVSVVLFRIDFPAQDFHHLSLRCQVADNRRWGMRMGDGICHGFFCGFHKKRVVYVRIG